ncbi:MAG: bifunctional hydroxymethylpyrimidine kinase/phosphomethylpyrimidine kinase [Candidatus Nitronauta litoralis]|uniref:hydroxymethylpyrimidine kinase n=1 Tax=Candidatus Nitronauta litoralis TaxID=2705533 RepID=A0A7T0BYM8_9BACT|nr:MAG: bifunctional hydroxymethylpyrimidine kinase/phosphomethylpyrimidine kinase [Candidatus Nitronauta litoralis]
MKSYTTALSIAGSDPSGGAGIQADLKTFSALGCYGMSVITALTSQNTMGVRGIFDVTSEFVESQLIAILDDIEVDAVKIGMLHSPAIIEVVARCLNKYSVEKLVVDPVMFAKSGDRLIRDDAIESLRKDLIPRATVLTPNLPEAGEFLKRSIKTRDHMEEAAHALLKEGPSCVVIKGGHLDSGGSDDYLAFRSESGIEGQWLYSRRETTPNMHGTGCTFSSAVGAYLAKGRELKEAVQSAKEYIAGTVQAGGEYSLGKGQGPVSHFYKLWKEGGEDNK